MLPLGLLIEIGKRATHAGIAAGKAIARSQSPEAKLQRKEYKELMKKAKAGRLGLSQAEQTQMAGEATRDLAAAQQAQQADLAASLAAGDASGRNALQLAGQQQAAQAGAAAQARQFTQQANAQAVTQQKARMEELAKAKSARGEQARQEIGAALMGQDGKDSKTGMESADGSLNTEELQKTFNTKKYKQGAGAATTAATTATTGA